MSTTTRVKTIDLKPGMQLAGRQKQTVAHVTTETVSGDGEFPDYEICFVYLEQEMYSPGLGMIAQNQQYEPDALHTVIAEVTE